MKPYRTFLLLPMALTMCQAFGQSASADVRQQSDTIAEEQSAAVVIEPLFEYPVAPEEIPDLAGKTNYLMDHFWDSMDFKSRAAVDQTALDHAFRTYIASAPYADEKKVIASVENIVKKIKGNEMLTIQFTKAAEEALYGPRADMWIDRLYMPFLEIYLKDKKIPDSRKTRYEYQYRLLKATEPGATAPSMNLVLRDGTGRGFKADKEFTLIEFGDPECADCRYAKMKLDISGIINGLLADGRLEVMFVVADDDEDGEMMEMVADYPEKWTVARSGDAIDSYDLRATPAFYVLGPGGRIIAKNVSVDTAIGILEAASTHPDSDKVKGKSSKKQK